MTIRRIAKKNVDFMKNLPSNILSELIILDDVIPDGILSTLCEVNPFYRKERSNFLEYNEDIIRQMRIRRKNRIVSDEKDINLKTDEDIEFIKNYPQFKQLVESVVYRDSNFNTVKVVPIDQYLAEN